MYQIIFEDHAKKEIQAYSQKDIFRIKYSKNLARYGTTVVSCRHAADPHDYNIYFNHCRDCQNLIDSRESRFKYKGKGVYICIHCGGGPEDPDYRKGDICPKCGHPHMRRGIRANVLHCSTCQHQMVAKV